MYPFSILLLLVKVLLSHNFTWFSLGKSIINKVKLSAPLPLLWLPLSQFYICTSLSNLVQLLTSIIPALKNYPNVPPPAPPSLWFIQIYKMNKNNLSIF